MHSFSNGGKYHRNLSEERCEQKEGSKTENRRSRQFWEGGIEYNLMRNGGVGGRKEEEKEREEEEKWDLRCLSCSSSCL